MQVFRFDPEVSIPVTRSGSRFSIGALIGDGAHVRAEVVHLPPGGLIADQVTTTPQMLAVIVGSGHATGAGGERRTLAPGYGVVWDAGEQQEVYSDPGLTAVRIEGDFEVWALSVTQDIVVADYDPAWPAWFESIRAHVWSAVSDLAVRVDHVGSTSVPGLAAKPIIDLDVVVASESDVDAAIDRLARLGYRWLGDLGVPGREAFAVPSHLDLPEHHLYLVVEDNRAHLDHWLLRDLLRQDPQARRRYAELKRQNAEAAGGDMDVYVRAKAWLVAELLTRAREEQGLPPVDYWEPAPTSGKS